LLRLAGGCCLLIGEHGLFEGEDDKGINGKPPPLPLIVKPSAYGWRGSDVDWMSTHWRGPRVVT
jgi:hypothetical protein